MKKSTVVIAVAFALGLLMTAMDLTSGPSLSLLASNLTFILVLTIVSVIVVASRGLGLGGAGAEPDLDRARKTPVKEMAEILKGASEGYTWNRREIALAMRAAVSAKLGGEAGPLRSEEMDTYLRKVLGEQSFDEFFSEDGWRATKVEGSRGYVVRLRDVVTSLTRSLGF